MEHMRVNKDFYSLDALTAAPLLLGKLLCRRLAGIADGDIVRLRITETEAYFGEEDTACHASRGKTPRTQVMYRQGGCAYIYLCYGIHSLLNVVTGAEEHPEAVLIRAVEGFMGPGRLTKAMQITKELNGEDLTESKHLWLEDDGLIPGYTTGRRVGIQYAAKEDIEKLWRFTIK